MIPKKMNPDNEFYDLAMRYNVTNVLKAISNRSAKANWVKYFQNTCFLK
jgi:hypothetical protein